MFESKMQQILQKLDSQSTKQPSSFQLKTNLHKPKEDQLREKLRKQVKEPFPKFKPNIVPRKKDKTQEIIRKHKIAQYQRERREVLVCVKRKRTDEPIEELYIESVNPKKKTKKGVKEITQQIKQVKIDSTKKDETKPSTQTTTQPSLVRFRYLDTASKESLPKILEKRKMLKDVAKLELSDIKEKQRMKFNKATKSLRLQKVNEVRVKSNVKVVELEAKEDEDDVDKYLELLKETAPEEYKQIVAEKKKEKKPEEYVYDYYYLDDSQPLHQLGDNSVKVRIDKFDEDLLVDEEYESESDEYDSEDSNAEEYYANDYPDEEEGEDISSSDSYDLNEEDDSEEDEKWWTTRKEQDEYDTEINDEEL